MFWVFTIFSSLIFHNNNNKKKDYTLFTSNFLQFFFTIQLLVCEEISFIIF